MKQKKHFIVLSLTVVMLLTPFVFSKGYSADKTTPATVDIMNVMSSNVSSSEDVFFDYEDISTEEPDLSVVSEKVAVNPNFVFSNKMQRIYTTEITGLFNSPVADEQRALTTVPRGKELVSVGYNEFNNTYKIKYDGDYLYVSAEKATPDKNLAFSNVDKKAYIKEGTSVFDYPSVSDGKALASLKINDELNIKAENDNYYEVEFNGNTGYVLKSLTSETKVVFENNFDWAHQYGAPSKRIPDNSNLTDMQIKIRNIALSNGSTQPTAAGYCAAWVSGVYQAAGMGYPGGNAIDYWTQWSSSGDTSILNIPVGAAVIGSGSSSSAGMTYGHVGIYVGDTDGDGEGEVAENIGYFAITPISEWINWQVTPVYPTYGGTYGPGFIGWVWPYGKALN